MNRTPTPMTMSAKARLPLLLLPLALCLGCVGPGRERQLALSVPVSGPIDASFGAVQRNLPLDLLGTPAPRLLSLVSEVEGELLVLHGRLLVKWPADRDARTVRLHLVDANGERLGTVRTVGRPLPTTAVHHRSETLSFTLELESLDGVERLQLEQGES